MDIVELGLLYDAEVEGPKVHVTYSLTSMGCPVGADDRAADPGGRREPRRRRAGRDASSPGSRPGARSACPTTPSSSSASASRLTSRHRSADAGADAYARRSSCRRSGTGTRACGRSVVDGATWPILSDLSCRLDDLAGRSSCAAAASEREDAVDDRLRAAARDELVDGLEVRLRPHRRADDRRAASTRSGGGWPAGSGRSWRRKPRCARPGRRPGTTSSMSPRRRARRRRRRRARP